MRHLEEYSQRVPISECVGLHQEIRCGHLAHHCTALMMSQPMNSKNLMQAVVDVKDEQIAGLRRELVKKDELIKEEIAKREKLGAGGERCSDENKAEIRREREVGSREEESKVKELKRQVNAMRDSSANYRMVSLFLLVTSLTSIAVILNRHMELNSALKQYSNCTQQLLHLTSECGIGQLKLQELQELRDVNKRLILLQGEFTECKHDVNTTTMNYLHANKQVDDLFKMLKKQDELLLSEAEKREDCYKLLKTCKDEASQLKKDKCQDELVQCRQKKSRKAL